MWVRIIIVAYNSGSWLQRVVDALTVQTNRDFEVVIVDNASADDSITTLKLPDDRFSLVAAGGNLGFAAGCNLGAAGATTPWLAMLNPDAIAAPDWLEQLYLATKKYPDSAAFGSTQISEEHRHILDGAGDCYSIFGIPWRGGYAAPLAKLPDHDGVILAPCAAASIYRRDVYEEMKGFDERYFCYLEDVDLGFRIRLAGYQCVQIVKAVVYHGGSVITGRYSRFTIYHSWRNRIWLLVKTMPLPLLPLALPLYASACGWLMGQMFNSEAFKFASDGLQDGAKGIHQAWKDRKTVTRNVSVWRVASWLVWNPLRIKRRAITYLKD